jgi:hypothetical protein
MRNILVTQFDGSDDVMVFTETLTAETVKEKLIAKGKSFEDIYEVETRDLQYFIYEPCWIP